METQRKDHGIFVLCLCRYNREEVVRSLGKEVNLNPPLTLGQLPDTPEELLKLDQVNFHFNFKDFTYFFFFPL